LRVPDLVPVASALRSAARRFAAGVLLLAAASVAHAACNGSICPINDGLRAIGARSVALVVSAAQAAEKPAPEASSAPSFPSQGKRGAVFMTAVSEDGEVYSHDHGPIVFPREARYALLALFVGGIALLYPLLTASDRSRLSPSVPPVPGSAATAMPVQQSAPDVSVAIEPLPASVAVARPQSPTIQEANWSTLVRLCGGDPVRAATVIAGETAADPSLAADSSETLARAIARVRK